MFMVLMGFVVCWLVLWLGEFVMQYLEVDLCIYVFDIVVDLYGGSVDFVVCYGDMLVMGNGLVIEWFFDDVYVFVCYLGLKVQLYDDLMCVLFIYFEW